MLVIVIGSYHHLHTVYFSTATADQQLQNWTPKGTNYDIPWIRSMIVSIAFSLKYKAAIAVAIGLERGAPLTMRIYQVAPYREV